MHGVGTKIFVLLLVPLIQQQHLPALAHSAATRRQPQRAGKMAVAEMSFAQS